MSHLRYAGLPFEEQRAAFLAIVQADPIVRDARLKRDRPELIAPFGLDDLFSFRVTPNRAVNNRRTHEEKGARVRRNWPEVTVVPW